MGQLICAFVLIGIISWCHRLFVYTKKRIRQRRIDEIKASYDERLEANNQAYLVAAEVLKQRLFQRYHSLVTVYRKAIDQNLGNTELAWKKLKHVDAVCNEEHLKLKSLYDAIEADILSECLAELAKHQLT